MKNTVSVIIPTFNRADFIKNAIESVINQTIPPVEIIVVDDGSTDNTKGALNPYMDRIKYIYQENNGVSSARNTGIRHATGKYIAFLDSDDLWKPEKLEKQVAILEKDPSVGLVYFHMPILNEKGERCGTKPSVQSGNNYKDFVTIGGDYPTSSVMVRKKCFKEVGYFDETLEAMEDYDMWLRIIKKYNVVQMKEELGIYRIHSKNITQDKIKVYIASINLGNKLKHKDNSKHYYFLSKEYYNIKEYKKALEALCNSLAINPFIGSVIIKKTKKGILWSLIGFLKPYIYFCLCISAIILKKFLHYFLFFLKSNQVPV